MADDPYRFVASHLQVMTPRGLSVRRKRTDHDGTDARITDFFDGLFRLCRPLAMSLNRQPVAMLWLLPACLCEAERIKLGGELP